MGTAKGAVLSFPAIFGEWSALVLKTVLIQKTQLCCPLGPGESLWVIYYVTPVTTLKQIHGVTFHPPATPDDCLTSFLFLPSLKGRSVQLLCCTSGYSHPVSLSKTRAVGLGPRAPGSSEWSFRQ